MVELHQNSGVHRCLHRLHLLLMQASLTRSVLIRANPRHFSCVASPLCNKSEELGGTTPPPPRRPTARMLSPDSPLLAELQILLELAGPVPDDCCTTSNHARFFAISAGQLRDLPINMPSCPNVALPTCMVTLQRCLCTACVRCLAS